jgi:hypothetical protein
MGGTGVYHKNPDNIVAIFYNKNGRYYHVDSWDRELSSRLNQSLVRIWKS